MAVNAFGVTQADVASMHFPHFTGGFTTSTKPTAVAVTLMVSESSGVLAGKLFGENIIASAIVTTTSIAFLMCAEQLRRMVAIKVHMALTQQDTPIAKALQAESKIWLDALAEGGGTFLGDDSLNTGTSDPDGPTTHISQYGLETDVADDMSSVLPSVRMGDGL